MEPRTPQNFKRVSVPNPLGLRCKCGRAGPWPLADNRASIFSSDWRSAVLAMYSSTPDSRAVIFSAIWPLPAARRIGLGLAIAFLSAKSRQERAMSDQGVCQSQTIKLGRCWRARARASSLSPAATMDHPCSFSPGVSRLRRASSPTMTKTVFMAAAYILSRSPKKHKALFDKLHPALEQNKGRGHEAPGHCYCEVLSVS